MTNRAAVSALTDSNRRPPRRPVHGEQPAPQVPTPPDGLPELRHAAGRRPGGAR